MKEFFRPKKFTSFNEMIEDALSKKPKLKIPTSDLCIQTENKDNPDKSGIIQFGFERKDVTPKREKVKPGVYNIVSTNFGPALSKLDLQEVEILEEVVNTADINENINAFFNNLDVYDSFKKPEPKVRKLLIWSDPGMGKCLGKDTPILMYDGKIKKVQDVVVGDQLMGPDSEPRNVTSVTTGKEELFKVKPTKGDSYIVNKSHILSLKMTGSEDVHNMTIDEYLNLSDTKKERLKGWRTGVEFYDQNQNTSRMIDPYILGLWLGDGKNDCGKVYSNDPEIQDEVSGYFDQIGLGVKIDTEKDGSGCDFVKGITRHGKSNIFINRLKYYNLHKNKHIPHNYKTSTRDERLKLLAGLIDSDGYLTSNTFDFNLKSEQLANDLVFLARSLGFAAYMKPNIKKCTNSANDHQGEYFRIQISGNTDEIPTILGRKKASPRKQIKDVLKTGIQLESLGVGDYYGFTIDGDHLFMLGDFTVTHNTASITSYCRKAVEDDKKTLVINWPTAQVRSSDAARLFNDHIDFSKCSKLILIIEDIGGTGAEGSGLKRVDQDLLDLLQGVSNPFTIPTVVLATTNYPYNLITALIDRPGRFDKVLQLKPPSVEDMIKIIEFMTGQDLSEDDKNAIRGKNAKGFSIAHIKEALIRSRLHQCSMEETIKELYDYRKKVKDSFQEKGNMGLGSYD